MFRARLPRRYVVGALAAASIPIAPKDKLPIYPTPDPELVLIEEPTQLEQRIGSTRQVVTSTYQDGYGYVQGWVSKWIGVEHAIERRIKSLIPADEPLTPGFLYTGVATLTGSVLTRNRILPLRLLTPPVFFVLSFQHFLPKTSANVSEYISSLEHTYFPRLAQTTDTAVAHTAMSVEMAKDAYATGKQRLATGVGIIIDQVQDTTGLKLKEALGWSHDIAQKVEEKGKEVLVAAEARTGEVKKTLDKKVEEPKKQV